MKISLQNLISNLFADVREFVIWSFCYPLVYIVHHLLAAHEVPDPVAGEDHPVVLDRVYLQGPDVGLRGDHLLGQRQTLVLLVGMVT